MLPEADVAHIRQYLDTDFEKRLFEAVLIQVTRQEDPLRANNFAYALRELSRHVLARLAPDDEVESAPWFVPVQNERRDNIITRPQRMKFAIQGFLEDAFLQNSLGIDYAAEIRSLKVEIENLSRFTHVQPSTFGVDETKVAELCQGALGSLAELFRSMFDCRERTLQAVAEAIDETVVAHVVEETLEGFYDFATHYAVEEVSIDNIECTGFEGEVIFGLVEGSVSVTLQYGSAGDRSRGDGLETPASASFSCEVSVSASDLRRISIRGGLEMDYDELKKSWGDDPEDDEEFEI